MDIEKIDEVLEAVLFLAGDSVEVAHLMEKLELQRSEVKRAAERLQKKYGGDSGIRLLSFNDKLQFCTNPAYADLVSAVLNPIREKELSRASLEVMAIIAYKQPVTRLEIEQVRGVNSDFAVQMLLKHGLIAVTGRKDAVGKPLLFGTTDGFLKRFGLKSLSDLPDYDALMERIKVIPADAPAESLYNEFALPDENGDGDGEDGGAFAPDGGEIPDFLKDEKDLQRIE